MTKQALLATALLALPSACADFEPQVGPLNHCTEVDGASVYTAGLGPTPSTSSIDSGCWSSYTTDGADDSYELYEDDNEDAADDSSRGDGATRSRKDAGHEDAH